MPDLVEFLIANCHDGDDHWRAQAQDTAEVVCLWFMDASGMADFQSYFKVPDA